MSCEQQQLADANKVSISYVDGDEPMERIVIARKGSAMKAREFDLGENYYVARRRVKVMKGNGTFDYDGTVFTRRGNEDATKDGTRKDRKDFTFNMHSRILPELYEAIGRLISGE